MDENDIQDSFLWKNQELPFLNLECLGGGSYEKLGKIIPINSNVSHGQSLEVDVKPSTSRKRIASLQNNGNGSDQRNGEEKSGGGCTHLERYRWIEREKRKKMRNMFTTLQSLLPQLPPKVGMSSVVNEAVKHIKTLEQTLNELQNQKMERLQCIETRTNLGITEMETREAVLTPEFPIVFKTWTSPSISLSVCGYDAHINICCSKKLGLFASICFVLEKYKIEVVSAHASSDYNRNMYMIHAHVISGSECQIPTEDIFKQATEEIITICG